MRGSDEMARGSTDGGFDSAGMGASGSFCTRAASAKKGAARAALVTVSEDASSLKEGRILREFALVRAGADAHVCPRVEKNRGEQASTIAEQ